MLLPTLKSSRASLARPNHKLRAWGDSNPRPSEPESDALSTELHALGDCRKSELSESRDKTSVTTSIAGIRPQ